MRLHHIDIADGAPEDELGSVSIAETDDPDSYQFTFEVGGDPHDTDRMASYGVVLGGLTDGGCIQYADLTERVLTLEFRESTARSFGLDDAVLRMRLEFEPGVVAALGRGLRTVFTSGPFDFRPVLGGDLAVEPGGHREVFLHFPDAEIALDELEEIVERVVGDAGEVTGTGAGQTGGNLDIAIWGDVDLPAVLRTLAGELVDAGLPGESEFHLIGENRRVSLRSLSGA